MPRQNICSKSWAVPCAVPFCSSYCQGLVHIPLPFVHSLLCFGVGVGGGLAISMLTCQALCQARARATILPARLSGGQTPLLRASPRRQRHANYRISSPLIVAFSPFGKPQLVSLSRVEHSAGVSVQVGRGYGVVRVKVTTDRPRPRLAMHWAVDNWRQPPEAVLPPGSVPAEGNAVRTPFFAGESVTITFPEAEAPSKLVFALREESRGALQWFNNLGRNFEASLTSRDFDNEEPVPPAPVGEPEVLLLTHYDEGIWVLVGKSNETGAYQVKVTSDCPRPNLVLHWGVDAWAAPPEGAAPPGSVRMGCGAVQTPFHGGESVAISFSEDECPSKLVFVLKEGEEWFNNDGNNFTALIKPQSVQAAVAPAPPCEPDPLARTHDGGVVVAVVNSKPAIWPAQWGLRDEEGAGAWT